jgi:uncharacterized protein
MIMRFASVAIVVMSLLLGVVGPAAALDLPALTGRVVDQAGILEASTRTALTAKLADLEAKTTDQLVVATVRSLEGTSVEDYANRLFREWKLGQKDKNNGVLLLVAPNERKVRIEVGYGLEGTLTDARARLVIESSILPRFRGRDFPGGIVRGADEIIQILTRTDQGASEARPLAGEWRDNGGSVAPPTFLGELGKLGYGLLQLVVLGVVFLLMALPSIFFIAILIYIPISLAVTFAIWMGWLPKRKKRGKGKDTGRAAWIDVFDTSSSGSSSSSSSPSSSSWSSSSSSSGSFSGGGGSSGGGGASGSW